MAADVGQTLKVFYCYAREDSALRDELAKHLGPLRREGLITEWHDREIEAGTHWEREIERQLNTSGIILLLVSPDFINSDYAYGVEMEKALALHAADRARVISIILRPVYWKNTPIAKLQVLPDDGKPVTSWGNKDEAFLNVVEGVDVAIRSFRTLLQEKERLAREQAARERMAREQAEKERIAREQAQMARLARQRRLLEERDDKDFFVPPPPSRSTTSVRRLSEIPPRQVANSPQPTSAPARRQRPSSQRNSPIPSANRHDQMYSWVLGILICTAVVAILLIVISGFSSNPSFTWFDTLSVGFIAYIVYILLPAMYKKINPIKLIIGQTYGDVVFAGIMILICSGGALIGEWLCSLLGWHLFWVIIGIAFVSAVALPVLIFIL